MKKYKQIEHTGDIGIRVYGQNREQLYEHAAYALFDLITDIKNVKPINEWIIEVSGTDQEELLVNWLSELNFVFQTEYRLFCVFNIIDLTETSLKAIVAGETIDRERHKIMNEIKAVTFHGLKMEESKAGNWEAQIIFDI